MKRSAYHRRYYKGGRLIFLTFVFWVLSGIVVLALLREVSIFQADSKEDSVAVQYIQSLFPMISRSQEIEARTNTESEDITQKETGESAEYVRTSGMLETLLSSVFPTMDIISAEERTELTDPESSGATDNGELNAEMTEDILDSQNQNGTWTSDVKLDLSKPTVLIYHTHATESYQPVSSGNFHSIDETGTVREVGNELAKALEEKGIQVIHDLTIHDSPSYNQSYNRSLETMTALIAKYPTAKIIIDLHRDAASYSGNQSKTVSIDGKTVADFSLVIGTKNENAGQLQKFAEYINQTANELYLGFGGNIISKPYKFNEYLSDCYLLLEVGNNENNIDQAKLTGKYFAEVLEQVIREMPQD